jgi:hypothetical protein
LALRRWSLPERSQVLRSQTAGPTVEMVVTLGEGQKPAWRWTATATVPAKAASIGVRVVRIVEQRSHLVFARRRWWSSCQRRCCV